MIRYSLLCDAEHAFDSWFDSSAAFDRLAEQHLVECPLCGSTQIRKALMTPNISTSRRAAQSEPVPQAPAAEVAVAEPAAAAGLLMAPPDRRLAELRLEALRLARAMREHVQRHADYVGERFAEEARRIHFGEVEAHGIYGKATAEEVRDLVEDGIEVHALPPLTDDAN